MSSPYKQAISGGLKFKSTSPDKQLSQAHASQNKQLQYHKVTQTKTATEIEFEEVQKKKARFHVPLHILTFK